MRFDRLDRKREFIHRDEVVALAIFYMFNGPVTSLSKNIRYEKLSVKHREKERGERENMREGE